MLLFGLCLGRVETEEGDARPAGIDAGSRKESVDDTGEKEFISPGRPCMCFTEEKEGFGSWSQLLRTEWVSWSMAVNVGD